MASTLFDVEEVQLETKSNEWFTPRVYIEAARAVMQGIDLDPASCELANQTVKAARYYTKEDDGLSKDWHGRVWCNPPWSRTGGPNGTRSSIGKWAHVLIDHYEAGRVEQAVLFIAAHTKGLWFAPLWKYPLCFTDHCVKFNRPGQETEDLRDSTVFTYLGPYISSFVDIFTEFGPVITPDGVHRRPAPLPQPTLWDQEVT